MYKQDTPRFSLKDQLFNKEKITMLAKEISSVSDLFNERAFIKDALEGFKTRELKERISFIAELFDEYIPGGYEQKLKVILTSLPEPLDPTRHDDDFGSFLYAPHSRFVAMYGNSKEHLKISLHAIREITKRFSAEFAIRTFLNHHYEETIKFLDECSKDANYHVRRLASEGTRPKLPWAEKVEIQRSDEKKILDRLHKDPTRYVTRSVANHLNDIYKTDPNVVYEILGEWIENGKQEREELLWIIRHALRNALALGDTRALRLLGYKKPQVSVTNQHQDQKSIAIGQSFEFHFTLVSTDYETQRLLINYSMEYAPSPETKKKQASSKNFKVADTSLRLGEERTFLKKHPMRVMSTKRLYPGIHTIRVRINGEEYLKYSFELI